MRTRSREVAMELWSGGGAPQRPGPRWGREAPARRLSHPSASQWSQIHVCDRPTGPPWRNLPGSPSSSRMRRAARRLEGAQSEVIRAI